MADETVEFVGAMIGEAQAKRLVDNLQKSGASGVDRNFELMTRATQMMGGTPTVPDMTPPLGTAPAAVQPISNPPPASAPPLKQPVPASAQPVGRPPSR